MLKMETLIIITIVCVLEAVNFANINAKVNIPDTVRIGILYGEKAVSDFNISSKGTITTNVFNGANYIKLFDMAVGTYSIRKDYDYSLNGKQYGQYHISYGETFDSYQEANVCAGLFKEKGLDAYPVYDDNWRVWAGFFKDETSAWEYIGTNVVPLLGEGAYGVEKPSSSRVIIFSKDQVKMVFENQSGVLSFLPYSNRKEDVLKLNEKGYRGRIEVRRIKNSDLTVINVLPLEEYLYGVVPREIGSTAHIEALKAQTVAARNYTIANMGKHSGYSFDLCATVDCQVYGGCDVETEITNNAVDQTKGKKLTYEGNIALTYYYASSGGRTESVENVWSTPIPYLKSVEDKYESGNSPNYNWEISFTRNQLKEKLLSKSINVGDIKTLRIKKLTPAKRVLELDVIGENGISTMAKEKCRTNFGVYSQLYDISTDADVYINESKTQLIGKKIITSNGVKEIGNSVAANVVNEDGTIKQFIAKPTVYRFAGKGWGHAVGMSQEGAKGMADNGFTYEQILTHYFPGTKIE